MADDVDISNFQYRTFNSSEYVFEITIYNVDSEASYRYAKDEINFLKIERDIVSYCSRGEVAVIDRANFLSVIANNDGKWRLEIYILQKEATGDVEYPAFIYDYLIESVDIQEIQDDGATVKLTFVDPIVQTMNRNVAYSSQGEKDISEVIKGLLSAAGFEASSENSNILPEIQTVGQNIEFVTDATSPLINNIDYLVSQTYSEDHGFLFLYYDTNEVAFKSYWSKDIMKEELILSDDKVKTENSAYLLSFNSSDDQQRNEGGVAELLQYGYLSPYTTNSRIIYPTYIQNFDYETCRMKTKAENQWSMDKFDKLFSQKDVVERTQLPDFLDDPSKRIGSILDFFKKAPDYALGNFYRVACADKFYTQLRTYFLYKNMTSIKVIGKIWRQPGRMYYIIYNQEANYGRIAGPWFCTKIVDEFKDKNFCQYIFLTRVGDYINYDNLSKIYNETMTKAEEGATN